MADPQSTGDEGVGSLAQETARLLHALAAETRKPSDDPDSPSGTGHVCSTGWCPICQVVGYVHQHPEVVEQVTDAAAQLGRTVREVLEHALAPTPSPQTAQPPDEA